MSNAKRRNNRSRATLWVAAILLLSPLVAFREAVPSGSDHWHSTPPPRCRGAEEHCKEDVFVSMKVRRTVPVRLLQKAGHRVRPIAALNRWRAGPVIVAARDLRLRRVRSRLRKSYAAGHSVGVLDGDEDAAAALARIVGARHWASTSGIESELGEWEADVLVMIRDLGATAAHPGGIRHAVVFSADVGLEDDGIDDLADQLSELISEDPAPVASSGEICSSPDDCINVSANTFQASAHVTNKHNDRLALTNEWQALRSFDQEYDYYFLAQSMDSTFKNHGPYYNADIDSQIFPPTNDTVLVNPQPGSSFCTTTITHTQTHSIGGSVGYSGTGLSGLTAVSTQGSSYAKKQSETCPDLMIAAESYSERSEAQWVRLYGSDTDLSNTTATTTNQAVFLVPFAAEDSLTNVGFMTFAQNSWTQKKNGDDAKYLSVELNANADTVDFPFPTQNPVAPIIESIAPYTSQTVYSGCDAVITGDNFYSGAIVAAVVGGLALTPDSSDGKLSALSCDESECNLTIELPNGVAKDQLIPVFVQTHYGLSNAGEILITNGGGTCPPVQ